jgi:hypothetical protein
MVVLKHPRSSFSKSTYRILHTIDNGKTLSWTSLESDTPSKKFPRFPIAECSEIRHAWTSSSFLPVVGVGSGGGLALSGGAADSLTCGTKTLRKKSNPKDSFLSFSLIYKDRTVDFTAVAADQAVVLIKGLNGLVFKGREEAIRKREGKTRRRTGEI